MAKIHTHYDNLKVARLAPQEVIRAAYKALSQKYHPDKNPGDEKAARIMAILNSAYGTLSDPVRRKEHDEWIAAEEWEIEWLESTRSDEAGKRGEPVHQWEPRPVPVPPRLSIARDPKWWLGLSVFFTAGCAVGALLIAQPKVLPVALASALAAKPEPRTEARAEPRPETRAEPAADAWARAPASEGPIQPPEVKAMAVTQFIIPARAPDCSTELHTLVAPNGEPWPAHTGYIDNYPIGNKGEEMQLTVDNSANTSAVFVKVFDLDRRSNVRHVYVQANDAMLIDKLAAGKYELRYQNVDAGAAPADCSTQRRNLRQAAANQPGT
jgi:hypothetical protein